MTRQTTLHNFNVPETGDADYADTFAQYFDSVDNAIEIRDTENNISNYEPQEGAKFTATDSGVIYIGDGSSWTQITSTGINPNFGNVTADSVNTKEINNVKTPLPKNGGAGINDAVSAGTKIELQSGVYELNSPIQIDADGLSLIGQGVESSEAGDNDTNITVLRKVHNGPMVETTSNEVRSVTIKGVAFDGQKSTYSGRGVDAGEVPNNWKIQDCVFYDIASEPIYADMLYNSWIQDNWFRRWGTSGNSDAIKIDKTGNTSPSHLKITGNDFRDGDGNSRDCINVETCDALRVQNNELNLPARHAVRIKECETLFLSGNYSEDAGDSGYVLGVTGADNIQHATVHANRASRGGTGYGFDYRNVRNSVVGENQAFNFNSGGARVGTDCKDFLWLTTNVGSDVTFNSQVYYTPNVVRQSTGDIVVLDDNGDIAKKITTTANKLYQGADYSTSNVSLDRTFDADNTTVNELADVVGTIISDLGLDIAR